MALDGVATPGLVELLMSDLSVYGFEAPIYFDESTPLALSEDDLYSQSCILMDAPTGNVLFAYEADAQRYPASTTKIMTLLVALEYGGLDETVTIPASAADVPKDSSLVPVYEGEQMSMRDLLYGLIIRSGNDAANAVAELCAGSVSAFVDRNERARAGAWNDRHPFRQSARLPRPGALLHRARPGHPHAAGPDGPGVLRNRHLPELCPARHLQTGRAAHSKRL